MAAHSRAPAVRKRNVEEEEEEEEGAGQLLGRGIFMYS